MYKPAASGLKRAAVIVDDFLDDPDAAREFALGLEYAADPSYFRGQRSTTAHPFRCVGTAVERLLGLRVTNWNPPGVANGVFQFCVAGDQLVYHSDANTHAAVLYLTPDPPPEAGTTLYRSRETKTRSVAEYVAGHADRGDAAALAADGERRMYAGKLLDRTAWEPVDVIGNRYNRLVVWDARLVHSASEYFGTDIRTGRLFQMYFFDAR